TPTRVLRLNLPPDEGGVDTQNRYALLQLELRQWAPALRVTTQLGLNDPVALGAEGVQYLQHLLGLVAQRFAVEPPWALQRDRLQGRLDHFHSGKHADGAERGKRLAKETWEAWDNAQGKGGWVTYTANLPLTPAALAARVQPIQEALRGNQQNLALALVDFLQ